MSNKAISSQPPYPRRGDQKRIPFDIYWEEGYIITSSDDGRMADNTAIRVGGLITRVGVDGVWVGAYEHKSYTYFAVNPGEHRLCTSQWSSLKSRRDNNASAITFKAEKGKVYYFRTQPTPTSLARSSSVGSAEWRGGTGGGRSRAGTADGSEVGL